MKTSKEPRILIFDLETSLLRFRGWNLGEQFIRHTQLEQEQHLMAWAAKWLDKKEIYYMDQRDRRDIKNDKKIVKELWKMINAADLVVYQNGDSFDQKVANTRFFEYELDPPSSTRSIDILKINRKRFKFPSNKLEYITNKFNKEHKKLKHEKFPGEELWLECERGNLAAWNEMEKYNIHDVLSTEEYFKRLLPWITGINIFPDGRCNCGANDWMKYGYRFTNHGRYQRLKCRKCGAEKRGEKA